jgi:hypothetical protein
MLPSGSGLFSAAGPAASAPISNLPAASSAPGWAASLRAPPGQFSSPAGAPDDRTSPFVSLSPIDNLGGLFSHDPSVPVGLFPFPFNSDPGPSSQFGAGLFSVGGPAASTPMSSMPGAASASGWATSLLAPLGPLPNPFAASAPALDGSSHLPLNSSDSAAPPPPRSQFDPPSSEGTADLGLVGGGKAGVQLACAEDACVGEALLLLEAIELAQLGCKIYQNYAGQRFLAGPYGKLSGNLPAGWQAHHLNQNGVYGEVIPRNEGFSVAMPGNIITEPGTPHYLYHRSLEQFLDQYREGGNLEFGAPRMLSTVRQGDVH